VQIYLAPISNSVLGEQDINHSFKVSLVAPKFPAGCSFVWSINDGTLCAECCPEHSCAFSENDI